MPTQTHNHDGGRTDPTLLAASPIAVTLEGAGALLGISAEAVHDLVTARRMPVVRIAGETLIAVEQLRALMPPVVLRAPDVAARLGCNPSQVYEMWSSGALPCVRVGRYKHMTDAQLTVWEERGGCASADEAPRVNHSVPEWVVAVERDEAARQVRTAMGMR